MPNLMFGRYKHRNKAIFRLATSIPYLLSCGYTYLEQYVFLPKNHLDQPDRTCYCLKQEAAFSHQAKQMHGIHMTNFRSYKAILVLCHI